MRRNWMRGLKQWRFLVAAAGLVLALGLVACGGDDDDEGGGGGEQTLDLVIGDSIPLTGDLSDFGPPGEKASDIAVSEINKAIQEAGVDHTVKVVHDDNGLMNRTAPPDSFQGPTLAEAMSQALGGAQGKTVNIGARNDSYGTGLAGTFGDAWEGLGGTIG